MRLCTGRTAHRGSRGIAVLYRHWGSVQAVRPIVRSRGIALLFLDYGTGRVWDASVTPCRSLPAGKTKYPLYRRLGGPQRRFGQVRKISPPPEFDSRTVLPVAIRYTDWATRPMLSDVWLYRKGPFSVHQTYVHYTTWTVPWQLSNCSDWALATLGALHNVSVCRNVYQCH